MGPLSGARVRSEDAVLAEVECLAVLDVVLPHHSFEPHSGLRHDAGRGRIGGEVARVDPVEAQCFEAEADDRADRLVA